MWKFNDNIAPNFVEHERNFVLGQLCMRCILTPTNPPAYAVRTSFGYGVGKGSAHQPAAVRVQWVAGLCGECGKCAVFRGVRNK